MLYIGWGTSLILQLTNNHVIIFIDRVNGKSLRLGPTAKAAPRFRGPIVSAYESHWTAGVDVNARLENDPPVADGALAREGFGLVGPEFCDWRDDSRAVPAVKTDEFSLSGDPQGIPQDK